jgi:hypothetical protein
VPVDTYNAELEQLMAKSRPKGASAEGTPVAATAGGDAAQPHLLPFFGSAAVLKTLSGADAEVVTLAPPARARQSATATDHAETQTGRLKKTQRSSGGAKPKASRVKRASANDPPPFSLFGF